MSNEKNKKDEKKGFLGKIIDKLDKKMEEKSKEQSCCNPSDKKNGKSCC